MVKQSLKSRYLLIDGNALVHRGFHAIPVLSTKTGEHTNAVYGFAMILLRAIKDLKPTHIACSFDLAGPTFRHEKYEDYKGTRVKAAQELYDQFPRVKEVVRALNIPIFEIEGFEADDVLGTLAKHICDKHEDDCDVMVVTGDLDSLQLVNKCVKVYTLRKGLTDTAIYDEAAIKERYGLTPHQMIDYKALRGDPSDNIKGVKGIGEKTAMDLIQQFGSIESLYKAIHSGEGLEKIKPRPLKLLIEGEEDAKFSYELSKIVTDVPLDIEIPEYEFHGQDLNNTVKLFQELEFRSLVDKLPKKYNGNTVAANNAAAKPKQTTPQAEQISSEPKPVSSIGQQNYQLIDSEEKLNLFLDKLSKQKSFVLDTETDSVNAIVAELVGVSICFKAGKAFYIPANLVLSSKELKDILENPKIHKIGQNIKYDLLTLQNVAINLQGIQFDTMLASYLLAAGSRQHGLDALAFNMLGYQMQSIEELIGKGKNQITMKEVPVEKVSWYACEDVDITFRLHELFEQQLKKESLQKIFAEIEIPLIPVLANMERAGIKVDTQLLADLSKRCEKELVKLESNIYKLAGEEFNIGSPKQLQEILYNKLGLTSGKKNKTGLSTAASELEKLRHEHEIVDLILSYRELSKLQSTYLQALPQLVNPSTGRIHTNYNQTIAATGRLSSTDPNLQNIPVRGDGVGSEIRKAFVAKEGYKLLALDYSQIELRIVAHLAEDDAMMEVFKEGRDIHTTTAMAVFDVPASEVTADMRRDAKIINFGILYGLSSFGLSSRIGEISWTDAKNFIDKYFQAYPQVHNYLERVKQEVREKTFITNELGRVRKFPEITSSQFFIRAAAERAAVNFPIQSMNADIIKLAMIEIDKQIAGQKDEIKMLLQVHDELVFEVRDDVIARWEAVIKPIMENSVKLKVPVVVESKVGPNWGDMGKL